MFRMYQNSKATAAKSVSEAATCCFVLKRCRTFDVSYKIAVPANATITNAKTLPRENPKIALAMINPRAANPPIARIGARNEKSARVTNTVVVIPRNKPSVVIPALMLSLIHI